MWNRIKGSYKKNKIPFIGLTAFLLIVLFSTALFNWYWTGTGASGTHDLLPNITNNYEEFKDYTTLYIPLLAFCASMFSGLVVLLVFYDWRDLKNFETKHSMLMKADYHRINFEDYFEDICLNIIEIHKCYSKNEFFLSNFLLNSDFNINNKDLNDFRNLMVRYKNLTQEKELLILVNEYIEIANELMHQNRGIMEDIYFKIADKYKKNGHNEWNNYTIHEYNSNNSIDQEKEKIKVLFNRAYNFIMIIVEKDGSENALNYKETYEHFSKIRSKINDELKNKILA